MLWDYPSHAGSARCIKTLHRLNIFGVDFLPGSGSSKIVTAAYDRTVQLHDLGRADSSSIPQRSDEPLPAGIRQVDYCHTQVFENHSESVKVRLASRQRAVLLHARWHQPSSYPPHPSPCRRT